MLINICLLNRLYCNSYIIKNWKITTGRSHRLQTEYYSCLRSFRAAGALINNVLFKQDIKYTQQNLKT